MNKLISKKIGLLFMILCLGFLFPLSALANSQNQESTKKPSAIYQVKTDKKVVALTFDISWGDKIPHPVLDVLADKNVQDATFFLSSPWASTHQDIVQRIDMMGYEIGTHGHKHVNYTEYSNDWIQQQVKKSEDILFEITGKRTNLIRTPNGDYNARVVKTLDKIGYKVIQWDTDSLDWMKPGVDKIVNRVLSKAHGGDIILMHASDSCPHTPEALVQIIDGLRAKGFEFVTVSELLEIGDEEIYYRSRS